MTDDQKKNGIPPAVASAIADLSYEDGRTAGALEQLAMQVSECNQRIRDMPSLADLPCKEHTRKLDELAHEIRSDRPTRTDATNERLKLQATVVRSKMWIKIAGLLVVMFGGGGGLLTWRAVTGTEKSAKRTNEAIQRLEQHRIVVVRSLPTPRDAGGEQ